MSKSKTVDELIDALGGTSAVARLCGVGPSTISNWRAAQSIPASRGLFFMDLCKKKRIAFDRSWFESEAA